VTGAVIPRTTSASASAMGGFGDALVAMVASLAHELAPLPAISRALP
jgi:hypothetical protein